MKWLCCLILVLVLAVYTQAEEHHDVDQPGHHYSNYSLKGMFNLSIHPILSEIILEKHMW